MKSIFITYGSTGGNTEMVAEKVGELLAAKKHKVTLQRAELSQPKDVLKSDILILASPTYGHGVLQEYMVAFIKGMKDNNLKGKPCAVISLGDPKYEAQYHIESAATLEKFLTDHGAKILLPALRISGTPVKHLKGLIPFWTEKLLASLGKSNFENRTSKKT